MVRRLQGITRDVSARVFRWMAVVARHRALACLTVAMLPVALRLAALPRKPIPEPVWDDEYSYLLGADTLASGRLAYPPHPMWVHFETFHVNWFPTYVTKFPPGQPLFLALGQKFFGHPWFGACISFGVMCAAICWMLQASMPPLFAMFGTLLAIAQIGIFRYWMDSYCGGAVPAIGGCLVIGAAIRLARRPGWLPALLGAFGLVVLANSRPYEGACVAAGAGLVMLWSMRRSKLRIAGLMTPQVLGPAGLIVLAGVAAIGYYNYRTTGNPLQMPYVVNNRMYAASSQFWLAPEMAVPEYRHEVIRNIWVIWTKDQWVRAHHNPLAILPWWKIVAGFFWSQLWCVGILGGLLLARSRKVWLSMAILAALLVGLTMQVSIAPHYVAPGLALLLIPSMYALRWVRVAGRRFGPALVLLLMGVAFVRSFQADTYHNWQEAPTRRPVSRVLSIYGGRHVVFVRYAPEHKIVMIDFVYNRADIDGSQIVWARYMGPEKDKELMDYYRDRQSWIWDADEKPLKLQPYPGK